MKELNYNLNEFFKDKETQKMFAIKNLDMECDFIETISKIKFENEDVYYKGVVQHFYIAIESALNFLLLSENINLNKANDHDLKGKYNLLNLKTKNQLNLNLPNQNLYNEIRFCGKLVKKVLSKWNISICYLDDALNTLIYFIINNYKDSTLIYLLEERK